MDSINEIFENNEVKVDNDHDDTEENNNNVKNNDNNSDNQSNTKDISNNQTNVKSKRKMPPSFTDNPLVNKPISFNRSSSTGLSKKLARKDTKEIDYEVVNIRTSRGVISNDEKNELLKYIKLSYSQIDTINSIAQGKSVFFTGAAGSGKSYIIQLLKDIYKFLNKSDCISFTAPTGVAACNIGGLTIHSWSGIGIAEGSTDVCVGKAMNNQKSSKSWKSTEILIIDEISMLSGDIFDLLSKIGSKIRNSVQPFGGIQLILCGDFFQLPPVGLGNGKKVFAFESEKWNKIFHSNESNRIINLTKVFRQKDKEFLILLNEIRLNKISNKTIQILNNKVYNSNRNVVDLTNNIRHTKLYARNNEVDAYNNLELNKLPISEQSKLKTNNILYQSVYDAKDEGNDYYLKQLQVGMKAPSRLELRIGAQVMLVKNIDTPIGLVNGARGVVKAFINTENEGVLPNVEFTLLVNNKRTLLNRTLSRCVWEISENNKVLASRTQIPLMLAWGISIHKSQGMTIPYLDISLSGVFEFGQAYVALSRATDLENTIIRNYNLKMIKTHPKVIEYYDQNFPHYNNINDNSNEEDLSIRLLDVIMLFDNEFKLYKNDTEYDDSIQTDTSVITNYLETRTNNSYRTSNVHNINSNTSSKSSENKLTFINKNMTESDYNTWIDNKDSKPIKLKEFPTIRSPNNVFFKNNINYSSNNISNQSVSNESNFNITKDTSSPTPKKRLTEQQQKEIEIKRQIALQKKKALELDNQRKDLLVEKTFQSYGI